MQGDSIYKVCIMMSIVSFSGAMINRFCQSNETGMPLLGSFECISSKQKEIAAIIAMFMAYV